MPSTKAPPRETDASAGASAAGAQVFLPTPLPWLAASLQTLVTQYTGHALLLHGAVGDGAHELALRLGQAWLCENTEPGRPKPCLRCASCHLYGQAAHPDQHWLLPEEMALARGMPVDIKPGRKPSRQIRVEEVRAFIDGLSTTTGRGQGKALVILPAEAMNGVAASALLKTLEEPPAGTRIVLAVSDPARLLPTIRSRCQHFRLPPPATDVALRWLGEQGVPRAETLLRACAGHPLDALGLHAAGVSAERWLALPQRLADGDVSAVAGWSPANALDALGKLCHDAMAAAVGGPLAFFDGAPMPSGLDLMRLSQWHRSLQGFSRHADHPWNEPLLAAALAREAQDALRPPTRAAASTSTSAGR
ncbi:MAG: DNA polymerase III subunit delta' [Rubrivivax sp.]